MINFTVDYNSPVSRARLGRLVTPHGVVQTPAFVPVATQAVIKTLTSEEAATAGSQLLIVNTYHLHFKPGEKFVAQAGGLHEFMHWPRPLMTDSGGFQVFSLGFGTDHGIGKILKAKSEEQIIKGQQPKNLKITNDGVHFKSPINGDDIFIGPIESIKIQEQLGADIIFTFDEATSPVADEHYTSQSLLRTHAWAEKCLAEKTSDQALYGIIQGGKFAALRQASSRFIGALPFDGFGIGGEYGDDKSNLKKILDWTIPKLPVNKPRHVLGIGHLEDIPGLIKAGADTFDCIVPTHYARHGTAFVRNNQGVRYSNEKYQAPSSLHPPHQRLDLYKKKFLSDQSPLDPTCHCRVCRQYQRAYIAHLLQAREITALRLLTFHNLHYFNSYINQLRNEIKTGQL